MVVQEEVKRGAEEVSADSEGVDVVHVEVRGGQVGEDAAAEEEGGDG